MYPEKVFSKYLYFVDNLKNNNLDTVTLFSDRGLEVVTIPNHRMRASADQLLDSWLHTHQVGHVFEIFPNSSFSHFFSTDLTPI